MKKGALEKLKNRSSRQSLSICTVHRAKERLQKARELASMPAAQKNAKIQELHKKIRV